MIAYDVVGRPFDSLGSKSKRRWEKMSKTIVELLGQGEEIGDRVIVGVEERDEDKARTTNEGIEEFKKKYPEYAKKLEDEIDKARRVKNKYLNYGLNNNRFISQEVYIGVMKDLGFKESEAHAWYPHIKDISERLKKPKETDARTILIDSKDLLK